MVLLPVEVLGHGEEPEGGEAAGRRALGAVVEGLGHRKGLEGAQNPR